MQRGRHGILVAALFMAAAGVVCAVLFVVNSSVADQRGIVLKQAAKSTKLADIWDSYKDNQKGGTYGSISYGTGRYWRGGEDWGVPQVLDCGMMANECNVYPSGSDYYATKPRAMLRTAGGARLQSLAEAASGLDKSAHEPKSAHRLSAAQKLQMVMRGMEAGDPDGEDMTSISQRAAYKVSRWMGGGYVKVYDLGSGR